MPEPSAVETSTTPGPFAGLVQEPTAAAPLRHMSVPEGVVMRLPVKSALCGSRMVLMVETKTSKLLRGPEPWRRTATVTVEPCAPVNVGIVDGHVALPVVATHTKPGPPWACTDSGIAGRAMRDANATSTSASNFFITTLAPMFFLWNQPYLSI